MQVARTAEVLDKAKVDYAVDAILDLFGQEEMTVAECVHSIRCLDCTLKANYPEAYELVEAVKGMG